MAQGGDSDPGTLLAAHTLATQRSSPQGLWAARSQTVRGGHPLRGPLLLLGDFGRFPAFPGKDLGQPLSDSLDSSGPDWKVWTPRSDPRSARGSWRASLSSAFHLLCALC